MAIKIKTIKSETFGDISFLWGSRILELIPNELGVKTISELGKHMQDSEDVGIIRKLLNLAHENACFFMKKDLQIEPNMMSYFIDDIGGIEEGFKIISAGISEMMRVNNPQLMGSTKKKTAPK